VDAQSTIPDIIIEESTRLDNIITDFLNFARPRTPDFHPCRIENIIEKNIAYLSPQMEDNNCKIIKEISDSLPEISADSAMLYQAFLNILINAFQSLKQNGFIIIKAKSVTGSIIINFIDNGEGVPEDILKKVWTPFFTTKDTGTGLGLGIVKNIIEAHNGTINITNEPPKGTNVEIRLPV
jgi:signal transduction histidine kinase